MKLTSGDPTASCSSCQSAKCVKPPQGWRGSVCLEVEAPKLVIVNVRDLQQTRLAESVCNALPNTSMHVLIAA